MAGMKVVGLVAGFGALLVVGLGASGCSGGMMSEHGGMSGHGHDAASPPPGVVNARCPIMGGAAKASLTRDYKGQKVGFCCGMCPGQWDKLTDAEKQAKLARVVPGGP